LKTASQIPDESRGRSTIGVLGRSHTRRKCFNAFSISASLDRFIDSIDRR